MSLGQKIAVYLLGLGACIGIASYASISYTIFPAFEEFEVDAAVNTIERIEQVMDGDRRTFQAMAEEYAHWDDTYNFVLGMHEEFVSENLGLAYWRSVGVDFLLILNNAGALVFSSDINSSNPGVLDLDALLIEPLGAAHPLRRPGRGYESTSGLLMTHEGPLFVAAAPVLTTSAEGPAVGTFIILRRIRDQIINDVSRRSGASIAFHPVTGQGAAGYSRAELDRMALAGELRQVDRQADATLGHRVLRDVTGRPAGVIEISQPHVITDIGSNSINSAMWFIGVVTFVFIAIALIVLRQMVVRPVNDLSDSMQHIRETGNLDVNVSTRRSDEIGKLAREFDEMTTNLHLAQKELQATRDVAVEASRAKSDFLARMSHEIRSPMNGVLGMTELLRNTSLDFEQRRFADTIYSSADSLLNIINDILDFSKIEAGKLDLEAHDIQLGVVVEETVDSMASQAHKKGLELINDVSPEVHTSLQGDPVRIRQVLTNLIANAIKFTNRGEIVVRATAGESSGSHVTVDFEVVDTGVGIKKDKQEHIFESFAQEDGSVTRLYGGTGLGLAISKQLVELMGGQLRVDSKPGLGSRFYFTLSMPRGDEQDLAGRARLTSVAGKRILIVDDNATNREILEQHLAGWRAHCDSARDAVEALSYLERAAASGESYNLVILDMHMPRIDGLQLARSIRDNRAFDETLLMLLSSVAMPASEAALDELKIAGQLTKPIRQSQLYDSLAVVLSGKTLTEDYPRKGAGSIRALSGRVLLAEDNPVNQAVALGMLDSLGVDVAVVTDGAAAVDACKALQFDLVLMDCQMPVMDGIEATRSIRAVERSAGAGHTPIVALTANALTGDRERCLEAGMDDYLGKPFTMDQLHAVLSIYLGGQEDQPKAASTYGQELEHASLYDTQAILAPPLDRGAFEVLAELQQPGAPCLIGKVIGIYLDSSRNLKERLVSAINDDDAGTVRESAHALKSSSVNVGATQLADLCKKLETMAREENLARARDIQPTLEMEYLRVIDALHVELEAAAK